MTALLFQTANEIRLDNGSTADGMEMERLTMWQHFAGLVTPSIQDIVEFAKRIPGFLEFAQDDQLILIKLGFFEVWLIHVSRSILAEEEGARGAVTFADGAYVTREQLEFVFDVSTASFKPNRDQCTRQCKLGSLELKFGDRDLKSP